MLSGSIQPPTLTNPISSTTSYGGGGGGGSSSGSSFTGITDQKVYSMLLQALQAAASGGDADYKAQRAERNAEIQRTRALSGDYSKGAAFKDAADLMAQQLRQSLEANMPAISKSIQGAGTSASSMQGLLSQKLATESAQAAGALGAKQATDYGQISGVLQGILERLTVPDNSNMQALAQLLNVAKTSSQAQSSITNPTNPMQPGSSYGVGSYLPSSGGFSGSSGDGSSGMLGGNTYTDWGFAPEDGYSVNPNISHLGGESFYDPNPPLRIDITGSSASPSYDPYYGSSSDDENFWQ